LTNFRRAAAYNSRNDFLTGGHHMRARIAAAFDAVFGPIWFKINARRASAQGPTVVSD
jgi:hypothetical protein